MSITTLVIILILFGGVGGVGWYGGWYGPGPNPPGGPAGPGPAYWNGGGIVSLLVTILVVVFLLRALHVGI